MTEKRLIYEKIPLIMAEIGAIEKHRTNPQQGYKFRGIDDVYAAAQPALVKHGVFCAPQVIDLKREERTTKSGSALFYTITTIKYTFYAADGSTFEAITIGEAMDSGDKSCNKAMSSAFKNAFLQIFCVPTEEPKDSENETHEPLPKTQATEPLTIENLLSKIKSIDALPYLTNTWKKYEQVIKSWPTEDFATAVAAFSARKKELGGK